MLYAALYIIYRRKIYGAFSNWHFKKETAIYILKSSWPLIITAVFSVIYTRIDQVMIKNMLNSSSVGIYDAAVRLSEAWNFIPGIIASSFFPAIINAKKALRNRIIFSAFKYTPDTLIIYVTNSVCVASPR
jgi:O-antigen/teichoic acid export membrane protein